MDRDLKVLAFDVFGTVFDWRSSVAAEIAEVASRHGMSVDAGEFADGWRRRYQPSMNRVRRGELGWTVLDELHRASLEEVLEEFRLKELPDHEREHLNLVWHRLQPWPEARPGLERLGGRYVLTTLSNGNFSLLTELVKNASLPFDCILSAELCRAYKPDPRTYRMTFELMRVRPEQVMMVAAHQDDLRAAAREGLGTAFVRRPLEWGAGAEVDLAADRNFDVVADGFVELADKLGT